MDGGAWWAAVHRVARSLTSLRDFTFTFHFSLSCIREGNGNPLQCSCLENPRDGGAWWASVYEVAQSWTRLKWLTSSSSSSSSSSVGGSWLLDRSPPSPLPLPTPLPASKINFSFQQTWIFIGFWAASGWAPLLLMKVLKLWHIHKNSPGCSEVY